MAELKEGILRLLKNYGMTDNEAEEYYKSRLKK